MQGVRDVSRKPFARAYSDDSCSIVPNHGRYFTSSRRHSQTALSAFVSASSFISSRINGILGRSLKTMQSAQGNIPCNDATFFRMD